MPEYVATSINPEIASSGEVPRIVLSEAQRQELRRLPVRGVSLSDTLRQIWQAGRSQITSLGILLGTTATIALATPETSSAQTVPCKPPQNWSTSILPIRLARWDSGTPELHSVNGSWWWHDKSDKGGITMRNIGPCTGMYVSNATGVLFYPGSKPGENLVAWDPQAWCRPHPDAPQHHSSCHMSP